MAIQNSNRGHIFVVGRKIQTSHLLSKMKSNTINFINNFYYWRQYIEEGVLWRRYFIPMNPGKIPLGSETSDKSYLPMAVWVFLRTTLGELPWTLEPHQSFLGLPGGRLDPGDVILGNGKGGSSVWEREITWTATTYLRQRCPGEEK